MKGRIRNTAAMAFLGGFLASVEARADFWVYEIERATATDLGTFGGDEAEALDVNDKVEVVGWARMSLGIPHGFIHRNGAMLDLTGSVGLLPAYATGINNHTEVVGYYEDPVTYKAFHWIEGQPLTTLRSSESGVEDYSWAHAINDHGRIVGGWLHYVNHCVYPSVQWANASASMEILYCPVLDWGTVVASDINDAGLIVGTEPTYTHVGFTWKDGVRTVVPGPISEEPVAYQYAEGVNDDGYVVGRINLYGWESGVYQAYLWNGQSPSVQLLGVLGGGKSSGAMEVNNQNMVAGYSEVLVGGGSLPLRRERAILWHGTFGMKALPLPQGFAAYATGCRANAVSNRNKFGDVTVVGYCTLAGKKRAVRWDLTVSRRATNIPPVGF